MDRYSFDLAESQQGYGSMDLYSQEGTLESLVHQATSSRISTVSPISKSDSAASSVDIQALPPFSRIMSGSGAKTGVNMVDSLTPKATSSPTLAWSAKPDISPGTSKQKYMGIDKNSLQPQQSSADDEEAAKDQDSIKLAEEQMILKRRNKEIAAALHNQCERERRERINREMNKLGQKMDPNFMYMEDTSTTVRMLDGMIKYLNYIQLHLKIANDMNISPKAVPQAIGQSLQSPTMVPVTVKGKSVMPTTDPLYNTNATLNSPTTLPTVRSAYCSSSGTINPIHAYGCACQSEPPPVDDIATVATVYEPQKFYSSSKN